ncbi:nucleoside deaminase [Microvirga guangxiensis]|uniref:tRNA(Arg) A34 adenosine deaminase TadA n=1 Tax=Microvirga guangxiensis TaxID=549386 RepID=A0A1G5KJE6_9HYPH|nr:nucleoside deaminase [Microvirga guangxiensis]SCZ00494.1 tRNA(Arg) A34 adenosine deaminase TadA [Microvirga guangxiensis]
MSPAERFLCEAIDLARENVRKGGRPFGAVLVKDGAVIATGVNEIHTTQDPTTHAELQAIRAASRALGSPRLDGCVVYASGHPCPMCLSAMHLTGIREVNYAYSNDDGEPYGLSTAAIYAELAKPLAEQSLKIAHVPVRLEEGDIYEMWRDATSVPPDGSDSGRSA